MLTIERLSRTKVHGHAVLHDPILFENLVENHEWPATLDHIVLGDDLEPIDHGFVPQNVAIVWDSQPDPNAVFGEAVKSICGHD